MPETTTDTKNTQDTEYLLRQGDFRLRVAPWGASVRGMWWEDEEEHYDCQDIITAYSGADGSIGSQGEVLMPFPSRIPHGQYTFQGQTHQLAVSDDFRPHAMHGFLRGVFWEMTHRSPAEITFSVVVKESDFPGYPFALRVSVTYRLNERGLVCDFQAENAGTTDAPFGAGFHPYFTVGSSLIDSDLLTVPFERQQIGGETTLVAGTKHDFLTTRAVGSLAANAVYTSPRRDSNGRARVRLNAPDQSRCVTVWMDETFDYVVLYSGDTQPDSLRRRALAIEPWTCAPNAFNYPERGLTVLKPGQTLSGSWGVYSSRALSLRVR